MVWEQTQIHDQRNVSEISDGCRIHKVPMTETSLEIHLNDFALRSFRDTADRDYVHARLAYRARLVPQFLWTSLHALEKYTKCVLLLNRISSKNIGHQVLSGLDRLKREGKFEVVLSEAVKEFVGHLELNEKIRYFEIPYHSREHDLIRLDCAVWELRRYCQPLNYDITINGAQRNMLQENLQRIRNHLERKVKGTCISHGWLEKVIADKKHQSREPLLWSNLYFGNSRRKSVRMKSFWEAGNAPLFLHPELIDEVKKYVQFGKGVEPAYRNLLVTRLDESHKE